MPNLRTMNSCLMLSLKHRYRFALAALVILAGCQTGEHSLARPDAAAEAQPYTAAEVAALRATHDIDTRLMALPGVVSIGIAGSEDNAWIQVLCVDDSLAVQAQEALGADVGDIPIRFEVTEEVRALPPDSSRQQ